MKLDSIYVDYFPEYSSYFGRDLILVKSIYGITNYVRLSANELIELLIESGFVKSQYQMYIYYNYVPDGTNTVVLPYVDDYVYCIYLKLLENGLWKL